MRDIGGAGAMRAGADRQLDRGEHREVAEHRQSVRQPELESRREIADTQSVTCRTGEAAEERELDPRGETDLDDGRGDDRPGPLTMVELRAGLELDPPRRHGSRMGRDGGPLRLRRMRVGLLGGERERREQADQRQWERRADHGPPSSEARRRSIRSKTTSTPWDLSGTRTR